MNLNGFEIDQENIHGIRAGATTSTCPECSELRRPENRKAKCMSVFWDTGIGQCNHCGARVQLHTYKKKGNPKAYTLPKRSPISSTLSDVLVKYFKDIRGISLDTLRALKIGESKRWMPKANAEISVIEFPYSVFGKVLNVKYRGKNKDFMFEKGCELVMFNLDAIAHEKVCVIVEGEVDCLAYVEAGIKNVVSVPNGFTLPKKDGSSSINLSFLDDYYTFFENKEKIILAVDKDDAGKHGERELISRFGAEKCWIVDFKDCKDANDYLLKYGKEKLAETVTSAVQIPIEFVETLDDFEQELDDFWINGAPKGYVTGMSNLDRNFSMEDGQYLVVTGPPQSGKSDFIDSICVGYALSYGFKTAFVSIENKPNRTHAHKIVRKIAGFTPRTREEVYSNRIKKAKEIYREHFSHIEFGNGYDIEKVLAKFSELVLRKGVKVFVIDPYNKVRMKNGSKNVNEYTADYMNEIDNFCRKHKVLVLVSMHPVKMTKIEGTETWKMPTPYEVKGGGEVYDMCYHMIGIVKDIERKLVMVKTLKVKFQHLGSPDVTFWFGWNVNNGRYVSVDYDPSHGEPPEIQWDNSPYFILQEGENKEVIEDERPKERWPETTSLIEVPKRKSVPSFGEPQESEIAPSDEEAPF